MNKALLRDLIHKLSIRNCRLVAVSKTKSVEEIMQVYNCGQKIFGENKVQEMVTKYDVLPKDIEWHMIGHLQTNKVKFIAPFITLIQSVDSERLLLEIDKEAKKNNRVIDCLLEIKIAQEESKFGLKTWEAEALLNSGLVKEISNIRIRGFMSIASDIRDPEIIRNEFRGLHLFFEKIKKTQADYFNILSMGMSGDYDIAIEEGSNMVRIGSAIFGERQKLNVSV